MPAGPTPFDDDNGRDPQHDQNTASRTGGGQSATTPPSRGSPNFLIRRAVVVGGVVAVLATASIIVGRLIGSGDDETQSGAVRADWNQIVLVDDRTGRVVVADTDGEEISRIESGLRSPAASTVIDSTLVVVGGGGGGTAVIDVADETVDEFDVAAETIGHPSGSALTAIAAQPDGGRALLVHGPSGDVIDTDTAAPVVGARYEFADARSSPSGRDVLVTDSGNFQSVLFSFDSDEPSYFPGLALAVDADLVVTVQNVGTDATINIFDHDGEPVTTGRSPSVRAGMIADSTVILVTVDGDIVAMSASDGETSELERLDIGAIESGDVTTNGDRLVVTGAAGIAIVGADGTIISTFENQRLTGAGQPPTGANCISTASDDDEPQIAVIDLADGSVLVEAPGVDPVLTDATGCTVATATSDGFDVLSADGVKQIQTGETLLAIAPDGLVVAAERDRRTVLLDIGTAQPAPDDAIDLGPRGRSVRFTKS